MEHTWHTHPQTPHYLILAGHANALVRTKAEWNGRYLWQFRNVVSYATTIADAKNYVEAGAEFFEVMHRNPYSS